jgi:hypothetical protein
MPHGMQLTVLTLIAHGVKHCVMTASSLVVTGAVQFITPIGLVGTDTFKLTDLAWFFVLNAKSHHTTLCFQDFSCPHHHFWWHNGDPIPTSPFAL